MTPTTTANADLLLRAAIDALPVQVCVINRQGLIVAVNQTWQAVQGGDDAAPEKQKFATGADYLAVCDTAAERGDESAGMMARAIRDIAAGRSSEACVEYPCHLPAERRWFEARLRVFECGGDRYVLVFHDNITERHVAQHALTRVTQQLNEAQKLAQVGSWELDLVTNTLHWSDEIFRIFEIDPKQFGASYEAFLAAIHPEDRGRVNQAYTTSLKTRSPYEITHRLLLPDGTVKYVQERCSSEFAADGTPLRSSGTVQDVTIAALGELALRESEERLRTIADFTHDWEYWIGPAREVRYISPSCTRITGYGQADFIGNTGLLRRIVHPDDSAAFAEHLLKFNERLEQSIDFRIVRRDGEIRWISHVCNPVYQRNGQFAGRRVSNRDITARKNAEDRVSQLAFYDELTGLPNRRMLLDRLGQACAQAARHQRPMALMFIDLDNFKDVNDTLGHDAGDQLLRTVAVRLSECVRAGDTVARQGGDEFVIVLTEITRSEDVAEVAKKILATMTPPIPLDRHHLNVSPSIGIAIYEGTGNCEIQDLLMRADKAMYAAKAGGRNTFRFDGAM